MYICIYVYIYIYIDGVFARCASHFNTTRCRSGIPVGPNRAPSTSPDINPCPHFTGRCPLFVGRGCLVFFFLATTAYPLHSRNTYKYSPRGDVIISKDRDFPIPCLFVILVLRRLRIVLDPLSNVAQRQWLSFEFELRSRVVGCGRTLEPEAPPRTRSTGCACTCS